VLIVYCYLRLPLPALWRPRRDWPRPPRERTTRVPAQRTQQASYHRATTDVPDTTAAHVALCIRIRATSAGRVLPGAVSVHDDPVLAVWHRVRVQYLGVWRDHRAWCAGLCERTCLCVPRAPTIRRPATACRMSDACRLLAFFRLSRSTPPKKIIAVSLPASKMIIVKICPLVFVTPHPHSLVFRCLCTSSPGSRVYHNMVSSFLYFFFVPSSFFSPPMFVPSRPLCPALMIRLITIPSSHASNIIVLVPCTQLSFSFFLSLSSGRCP
jgi:hypothetical protein